MRVMSEIKVSFIVPCYNSAATIKRCVDSILAQTFSNIELIIIDDGSTDNTVALVQNYKEYDSRITLIKQKHGGPNMAREAGVKKASGEYIMFVDSDDYIVKDAVAILVEAIKKHGVDFIRFNLANACNGEVFQPILRANERMKIINKGEIVELLLTTYKLNNLCSQIYKADKIKKMKTFHSDIIFGEDFLVNLELHQNTNRMLVLNGKPLYFYCENPNSTTRNTDKEKVFSNISDRIFISNRAICYAREKVGDTKLRTEIIYSQIRMVNDSIMKIGGISGYRKNQFMKEISNLLNQDSLPDINKNSIKRYMETLNLFEMIRNGRAVLAVMSLNYNTLWRYISLYRIYSWRKRI